MKRIEHTISFTITGGDTSLFVKRLAEELVGFLTQDIGLGLVDRTSANRNEKLTFQYKDLKPYVCIGIESSGSTSEVYVYAGNALFDGSFQRGGNAVNILSPVIGYTLKATVRILMSESFFSIKFDSIVLSNIGSCGVAFFKTKNFRTGEEEAAFAGKNCAAFMVDVRGASTLVQKSGESSFESVGYAITTSPCNFVNSNTLLFPAFLSQNYNGVFYTDWYIDELFVSLLGTFTGGAKYRIDGKTYFAVTPRCLVELTDEIID